MITPLSKNIYVSGQEFTEHIVNLKIIYFRTSYIELVELKQFINIWRALKMMEKKVKNKTLLQINKKILNLYYLIFIIQFLIEYVSQIQF